MRITSLTLRFVATVLLQLVCVPLLATTWYVRKDGGTRYSKNATNGECDGKADAAYSGKGVNQHCAFNDVRLLWQDGSYVTDGSPFPAWGWVIAGGDTVIIRGSIAQGVSYRVGWSNGNSCIDDKVGPKQVQARGICGNSISSGMPSPPSGTATQHTRILGENYASCHDRSARTQLHGGWGAGHVVALSGASYVDMACLDITDFSACGKASQSVSCEGQDFATNGIELSNTSTHDTLTDIRVHGLAAGGISGPTGDGFTMDYVDVLGNASSGWNADNGTQTTGVGSLKVSHYDISWNGCAEEYPIVDSVPYGDCTDDNSGGYGDGFGTASVQSNPAWHIRFTQGIASYNTQDGLDALHVNGGGSTIAIDRTLAYGNMGNQLKSGSDGGTSLTNNVIVGNCFAMHNAIPGTPSGYNKKLSDFCRAGNDAVAFILNSGTLGYFVGNTIYGSTYNGGGALALFVCGTSPCEATTRIVYANNVFVGFNTNGRGYPPQYDLEGTFKSSPFRNSGSIYSNNLHYNLSSPCPDRGETSVVCSKPGLVDETFHSYGYGDMSPLATGNAVQGKGVGVSSMTTDYAGVPRRNPPTIGAYEGKQPQPTTSATKPQETPHEGSSRPVAALAVAGAVVVATGSWVAVRRFRSPS